MQFFENDENGENEAGVSTEQGGAPPFRKHKARKPTPLPYLPSLIRPPEGASWRATANCR